MCRRRRNRTQRRGEDAAKTTEASTSASKGVKQTGASSSTEQRPPCTRLTKEGADKLGKTKCQTLAAALVAECASCVKRKLKGKPLLTKREMWASALRRLMYEKRHVDDETMRKIVAWVGENKADMRRPVWLEASIKERGLESFAPGYVTAPRGGVGSRIGTIGSSCSRCCMMNL
jgi:hypothetical protein